MKHKLFSFSAILAAILSLTACGSGESAADVNYSEIASSDGSLVFTTSSTPEISTEPSVEPIIPSAEISEETSAVPTTEVTTVTTETETIVTVPAPEPSEYQELKVHFLDVGQGDSCFIELPNKETMLIDAGESEYGDSIVTYIYGQGYDTLDYVVATHPHAAHIGGMADVLNTFNIKNFYATSFTTTTQTYEHMLDAVENSGAAVHEVMAVEDATYQAGAREVAIIEEPIAAAIGAGIDISRPCGNMIVDIGGGSTDIAVISLGGTVVSTSIKIAGDDFGEAIVRYMRKKHNLLIGERTVEDIKINIGSAFPRAEVVSMDIRGRNLVTGLPKTVTVTSAETEEALKEATSQIVEAIHSVLEKTPPELAADIADRGMVLTGGGSLLQGLEELIEEKTGINTMTAEDPMTAVAIGTGKFIEFLAGDR